MVSARNEGSFIGRELSIYLDLMRFLAALAVVIGHGVQDGLYTGTAGSFPLSGFAHEAVIVFFVLSGLVIAATADRPTETLRSFAVARLARVYSVALPAVAISIALPAVLGGLGLIAADRDPTSELTLWSVVSSLFFLNESWANGAALPWNQPYWSLCYEVWYYVIFGTLFFGRGSARWWLTALAVVAAGPRVMALAPIWAMGVWMFHDGRLRIKSAAVGALVAAASACTIWWTTNAGVSRAVQDFASAHVPGWWYLASSQFVLTDLVLGLVVAAHLIGMNACCPHLGGLLRRIERPIRYMAGSTFSLYLFHRPIMKALDAMEVSAGTSALAFTLLLIAVVALTSVLAIFTERKRDLARRTVESAFVPLKALRRRLA